MHPFPHTYTAAATAAAAGTVTVTSPELPALETSAPPQFDGPGGHWSPETLLCAALADCFVLTFRAVSRMSRLPWTRLECRVDAVLERVERISRFTRIVTHARLVVPPGTDVEMAHRLLGQAEHGCLISNSLSATRTLEAQVEADTA